LVIIQIFAATALAQFAQNCSAEQIVAESRAEIKQQVRWRHRGTGRQGEAGGAKGIGEFDVTCHRS